MMEEEMMMKPAMMQGGYGYQRMGYQRRYKRDATPEKVQQVINILLMLLLLLLMLLLLLLVLSLLLLFLVQIL